MRGHGLRSTPARARTKAAPQVDKQQTARHPHLKTQTLPLTLHLPPHTLKKTHCHSQNTRTILHSCNRQWRPQIQLMPLSPAAPTSTLSHTQFQRTHPSRTPSASLLPTHSSTPRLLSSLPTPSSSPAPASNSSIYAFSDPLKQGSRSFLTKAVHANGM